MRETRESIERALAKQRRNRLRLEREILEKMLERVERHLDEMRKIMDPAQFAKVETKFREAIHEIAVQLRPKRRRPGDGNMPALVEPPRGPKPLIGGAAAPLDFGD